MNDAETQLYSGWNKIAADNDLNAVAKYIVTDNTVADFVPDAWLYSSLYPTSDDVSILDFGCGIGRNSYGMALHSANWNILGYDNPAMIEKTNQYFNAKYPSEFSVPKNVFFTSNWNITRGLKFDSIMCCLVLQHITELYLSVYLNDFKSMTNELIISGRRFNDDSKKNTWGIIENAGFVPYKCIGWSPDGFGEIKYRKDGDENEHMTCFYRF
jgi:2-polyprenyl-3-methyl-5-hydroxy-6-metoxy-1,4-benzoquinol methylase